MLRREKKFVMLEKGECIFMFKNKSLFKKEKIGKRKDIEESIGIETKAEGATFKSGERFLSKVIFSCCLISLVILGATFLTCRFLFLNITLPFLRKIGKETKKKIEREEYLKDFKGQRNIFEPIPTVIKNKEKENILIPSNFPSDFPIYPGAKIVSGKSGTSSSKNVFLLNLETSEEIRKVTDFYEEKLPLLGWQIERNNASELANFLFIKKGKESGLVSVFQEKDKKVTRVNIVFSKGL